MARGDILLGAVALGRSGATCHRSVQVRDCERKQLSCLHLSLYPEAMSEGKSGVGNLGNAHQSRESQEIIRRSRCRSTHLELYMQHERTQMYKQKQGRG